MRFLFALSMIAGCALAQETAPVTLEDKLGLQLFNRQIRSVAILRFTNNQNYDSQFSAHMVDQLNRALVSQNRGFEVASRSQVDALLRELRVGDNPEINSKDLQTIATRLGVNALIAGTFLATPKTVAIDLTVFDGSSAHIIGGESVKLDRADVEPYLVMRKGPAPGPSLTIPSGTALEVRMNEKVDAEACRNGKTVSGTLESNVVVDGVTVARKGAEVKMQATSADGMELHLALASIMMADQKIVPASSEPVIRAATSSKSKAALGGVLGGGGISPGMQGTPKAGEAAKNSVLSFHLNQDAR